MSERREYELANGGRLIVEKVPLIEFDVDAIARSLPDYFGDEVVDWTECDCLCHQHPDWTPPHYHGEICPCEVKSDTPKG